jgi:hypothetical protein
MQMAWHAPGLIGALASLLMLSATLTQPSAVRAAAAPCDSDPERPAARPPAPGAVAANLTGPFKYVPAQTDNAAVLAEVSDVVRAQATGLGVDGCYVGKPDRIARRVDFLSPFEFLVVTTFDSDPARRDALLDQYAVDPAGAINGLGDAYPSPRSEATLASYAYFDVSSDRIRVNAARVPADQLRRVLVHEFWHAMPHTRTWTERDGRTIRASGFWLQEQREGRRTWVPVEDRQGLPYASYLLDEAMATYMENQYAGPQPYARAEVGDVLQFLGRLIGVAGSGAVLGTYLESQPYELGHLAEAHRASLPELELIARP